ncbi:A-kinase anchor protein 13-like [Uloborus diversus]|uniref:A-kinase anchor protein 13-like n=1 Tax=Uloborus diversus TaxID=327109 RepID=UPI00240A0BB4|nr:A-kinase anchor protein 13-like [Uloborus diversus]
MNVSPKDAPVYGGGKIIVEILDQPLLEDVNYYLVFEGSQHRHVTVAEPSWTGGTLKLKARIPSHSSAEEVELSAYVGLGTTRLASTRFQYASDSAHQMALFLLGCPDRPEPLKELADRGPLAPEDRCQLDRKLTAVFKTLQLPRCWNMMGTDLKGSESTERLLHFSARLGLSELSAHFLSLPGSQAALSAPNHEGLLPEDLALQNGYHDLSSLLQFCRKQENGFEPYKSAVEPKEKVQPLVITTDIKQNHTDVEHDILELEEQKLLLSDIESEDNDTENMKELNPTQNGHLQENLMFKLKDAQIFNNSNRSASLPRHALRNQIPRFQTRVVAGDGVVPKLAE